MKRIDLNVDLAEGFPHDIELLKYATSANLCCGVHAGDQSLTREVAAACRRANVRIGAHPGYPDRASMGRVAISDGTQLAYLSSVFEQVRWFVDEIGASYIKPHGGFYNDTAILLPPDWETRSRKSRTATPYETAGVYLATVPGLQSLGMILRVHRLPLLGLPRTAHEVVAARACQGFIREGFADRRYTEAGTLESRAVPGSMLENEADIREQVLRLAPTVDSMCLHGDTPNCVDLAALIRSCLEEAGYGVGV